MLYRRRQPSTIMLSLSTTLALLCTILPATTAARRRRPTLLGARGPLPRRFMYSIRLEAVETQRHRGPQPRGRPYRRSKSMMNRRHQLWRARPFRRGLTLLGELMRRIRQVVDIQPIALLSKEASGPFRCGHLSRSRSLQRLPAGQTGASALCRKGSMCRHQLTRIGITTACSRRPTHTFVLSGAAPHRR